MYFSLAVTSMRAEFPSGKVPTTLVPPPGLAVDTLDFVIRPDPAPVLEREFRAGQRLGEPVVHRPRGRSEPHRLQLVLHLLGLPAACLARFLHGIAFNIRATAFRLVTGTLPCMLR